MEPLPEPTPSELAPFEPAPAEPQRALPIGWLVGGGALLLLLAGLLLWRSRRRPEEQVVEERYVPVPEPVEVAPPAPVTPPTPPVTPPVAAAVPPAEPQFLRRPAPPAAPSSEPKFLVRPVAPVTPTAAPESRPKLECGFLPMRVGTQGQEALLHFELTARNPADVAVEEVRFATAVVSANPHQDEQIERFLADVPEAALVDRFPLNAAGGARRIEATLVLPLDRVNVMTARDRPFFVPMIVIDALYRWADGLVSRTSVVFVIGRPIPDSDKLAPIFLDRGERLYDRLEARLHGEVRRS